MKAERKYIRKAPLKKPATAKEPPPAKPPKSKNIDWALIEKQLAQGITQTAIAHSLGLSHSAFYNRMTRRNNSVNTLPVLSDTQDLDNFKKNRADVFADKQREIVAALTPEKIEKCNGYQLAGMASLFYDKERLERGMSTDNVTLVQRIIGMSNDLPVPTVEAVVSRSVNPPVDNP